MSGFCGTGGRGSTTVSGTDAYSPLDCLAAAGLVSLCGGPIRGDSQRRWSVPPSLCRFRPRCVWIAGRRFWNFSELIVPQPPALYIPHEHVISALSAGPDVRIVNPALELRSKLLSIVMCGDPAPTAFSTIGSRLITRVNRLPQSRPDSPIFWIMPAKAWRADSRWEA